MAEIDVKAELARYQAELNSLMQQLQAVENQRATLLQAIAERRGIIAFLNSLNQNKEE